MELDIEKIKAETKEHLARNKIVLLLLFTSGILGFWVISSNAPALSNEDKKILYQVPANPRVLAMMSKIVQKYAALNFYYVIFAISYLYILLHSFSIPGPPLINILVGALFGFFPSFVLVHICSFVGAILCYVIFETIGKGIAIRMFPNAIVRVHKKVKDNKENMLFYLLSLRVTPFIPKWMSNISSPIIGVPIKTYVISTVLGLMPHNVIHINAGIAINSMQDFGMTMNNFLCLAGLGLLSLVPTLIFKKNQKEEIEEKEQREEKEKKEE